MDKRSQPVDKDYAFLLKCAHELSALWAILEEEAHDELSNLPTSGDRLSCLDAR